MSARVVTDDRWVYAQQLRDAGYTLEEIGGQIGVTRERVRQKTERRNVARASSARVDPLQLLALIRSDRSINSVKEISRRTGRDVARINECLIAMGLLPAVKRLVRWRKTYATRQRYAAILRAEYERLGRTPTSVEFSAAAGVHRSTGTSLLAGSFGSVRRAMEYIGAVPRAVGYQGHVFRKPLNPVCGVCGAQKRRRADTGYSECPKRGTHSRLRRERPAVGRSGSPEQSGEGPSRAVRRHPNNETLILPSTSEQTNG